MDVDARVETWAWLQLVPGLDAEALFTLLKALGDPAAVRGASRASLLRSVSAEVAAALRRGPAAGELESTLTWLAHPGHWLLAWGDADYPAALLATTAPPPVLYYIGRRELLNRPAIAIVGSRNATPEGVGHARAFAEALSAAGWTIFGRLSGGVDAAAQLGGLAAAGGSVAAVAAGLDRVDPPSLRPLAGQLARDGGLVSEFSPGSAPGPAHFSRRGRLLGDLCRGVLVIEATLGSGALGVARHAAAQGREVFAIPGSIHSPFSKGGHRLIREGAKLVETVADVLEEFPSQQPPGVPSPRPADAAPRPRRLPRA